MPNGRMTNPVTLRCTSCGVSSVVSVHVGRAHGWGTGGALTREQIIERARSKLRSDNWTDSGGPLLCPNCNNSRRQAPRQRNRIMTRPTPTTPATAMTATPTPTPADRPEDRPVDRPTPVPATSAPAAMEDARLRQPTASQKLEIVLMLAEVYDRKAGRYKGSETDATVAAALEDGIMPGWVAVQRAELFGPSGANEDMSRLGAEVAVLRDKTERELRALRLHMESAEGQTRAITESLEALVAIEKRLQSLVASAGPKARSR